MEVGETNKRTDRKKKKKSKRQKKMEQNPWKEE